MYLSQIPEQIRQLEAYSKLTKLYLLYKHQRGLIKDPAANVLDMDTITQIKLMTGRVHSKFMSRIESFDIIYCRGHIAGMVGLGIRRRHKLKSKVVIDFRGSILDELSQENGLRIKAKQGFFRLVERYEIQKADKILVVSRNFANHLEKKYGISIRNKLIIMRPFINPDKFKFNSRSRSKIRKNLGFATDDKVLIYAGGDSWWDCVDETLDIFKKLNKLDSRIKLLVLTAMENSIVAKLESRGLHSKDWRVLFASNELMPDYLSAADFAFMLRKDCTASHVAYPTKFAEYLLTGTPVLIEPHIGCYPDANFRNSISIHRESLSYEKLLSAILNAHFDRKAIAGDYRKIISNKELHKYLRGTS